ncbi:MAG: radical SAM protein [Proteobacteria bacterium]|nr:radical SAM protein [Pseudomonadota bacterium]MBU1708435.1 radical SAM protein [Pseudomonadota bacterium]
MYSPFRHLGSLFWKCKPIQLTFFLTRRCNARCPFCFYLSREEDASPRSEELTLAEIEKVSFSMGKLLWLAFSGGEIFLRNDLVEITRVFYKNNQPAIILFPTNALLTGIIHERIEAILKACPQSSIVVKLSLDGPEEVHDAIRGVPGAYRKVLATYEALGPLLDKYSNFDLGINTVFCSENQDYVDQTIDFVSGLGKIRTHTVSLIRGDVSDDKLKQVDLEKYHRTINRMEADLKGRKAPVYGFSGARLKAAQDILQRRMIYQTARQNRQLLPCFAGKINLVLSETGELYPCESFNMPLGNVRDHGYDLLNMLKTDRARDTIRSIAKNRCFCTHECYIMTNILFNPMKAPQLIKEYLQL